MLHVGGSGPARCPRMGASSRGGIAYYSVAVFLGADA